MDQPQTRNFCVGSLSSLNLPFMSTTTLLLVYHLRLHLRRSLPSFTYYTYTPHTPLSLFSVLLFGRGSDAIPFFLFYNN